MTPTKTVARTAHPEIVPVGDDEITQRLTREQAESMLDRMTSAGQHARLAITEWYVAYKQLHDLGGFLALGYRSWGEFTERALGIERGKSYRLLQVGAIVGELRELGINVESDSVISQAQAAVLAHDPGAVREVARDVKGGGATVKEAVRAAVNARRDPPRVPAVARGSNSPAPVAARSRPVQRGSSETFVPSQAEAAKLGELRVLSNELTAIETSWDQMLERRKRLLVWFRDSSMAPVSVLAEASGVTPGRIRQLQSP